MQRDELVLVENRCSQLDQPALPRHNLQFLNVPIVVIDGLARTDHLDFGLAHFPRNGCPVLVERLLGMRDGEPYLLHQRPKRLAGGR